MSDQKRPLSSGATTAFDYQSIYTRDSFTSVFQYNQLIPSNSGQRCQQKDNIREQTKVDKLMHDVVIMSCWLLCVLLFPISVWMSIKRLKPHERLVIFRLGRLQPAKGPGIVFIIPKIDQIRKIDTRTRAFNVPPQKIFTSDNGVVEVGADVYFHVVDAVQSVLHVQDLGRSVRLLAQLTLMNQVSKATLKSLQNERRNNLATIIADTMNNSVGDWGIKIEKFELSHVTVIHKEPPSNALSSVLTALGGSMPAEQASVLQMMAGAVMTKSQSTLVDLTPSRDHTCSLPELAVQILRDVIDVTMVTELHAVYKFVLTGDNGGDFYLDAKHDNGYVDVGPPLHVPDVTMTSSAADFHQLISGDVSPLTLYMGGRLGVEGDLSLAMKLEVLSNKIAKLNKTTTRPNYPPNYPPNYVPQFAEGFVQHL